jgi:hypothetical protein
MYWYTVSWPVKLYLDHWASGGSLELDPPDLAERVDEFREGYGEL